MLVAPLAAFAQDAESVAISGQIIDERTNRSLAGSNYPLAGYLGPQAVSPNVLALFGGSPADFLGLTDRRNTLRLPSYARLDVRADRTFVRARHRITVFAEVANVLNRTNWRNVPYDFDRTGRVFGARDTLMPIVPSAGFVVEFWVRVWSFVFGL